MESEVFQTSQRLVDIESLVDNKLHHVLTLNTKM